jgi:RND superfamily putative drug exporter
MSTLWRLPTLRAPQTLLGDHAWWLPAWLDKILPNVSLEGHLVEGLDSKEPEPARVAV